jgi:hypothetical protein
MLGLTTATHHAQHHESFRANFSLHFNVWDRLMGPITPGTRSGSLRQWETMGDSRRSVLADRWPRYWAALTAEWRSRRTKPITTPATSARPQAADAGKLHFRHYLSSSGIEGDYLTYPVDELSFNSQWNHFILNAILHNSRKGLKVR